MSQLISTACSNAARARASSPPRAYTWPSASASHGVPARSGPSRASSSSRAVRPASETRSSRLCSRTGRERPGIAAADELKVARRNLEPRHIADAADAQQFFFERDERARRARARAGRAPEPPRRMQHVDMRQPRRPVPLEPMEEIPRLEHRRVERLAVEADDRARAKKFSRDAAEHRPLDAVLGEHMLPHHEAAILVEPAAADKKGVRPRAAAQPGRFQIEEHQRRPSRRPAGEPGKQSRVGCPLRDLRRQIADPRSAVGRVRVEATLDDEARFPLVPLSAEDVDQRLRDGVPR